MSEKGKRTEHSLGILAFKKNFEYDKRRYDRAAQTVKETVEHYFGDISKETIEHYSGDISADYIHHTKGRVKKLESILEKVAVFAGMKDVLLLWISTI